MYSITVILGRLNYVQLIMSQLVEDRILKFLSFIKSRKNFKTFYYITTYST